ncbi:hypothetical protein [Pseudogemmobacter sonorensis]|uniref:hypothetical protein n=1 Tax=Pseudogemmobacter sonorensis TaxID=2989681 RepID=UPI0036BF7E6F
MNAITHNIPQALGARQQALVARKGVLWMIAREGGKLSHLDMTDELKRFSTYVGPDRKASSQPKLVYVVFQRMVYRPLGLNKEEVRARMEGRDDFDMVTLNAVSTMEAAVARIVRSGMANGKTRDQIKAAVRLACDEFATQVRRIENDDFYEVVQ